MKRNKIIIVLIKKTLVFSDVFAGGAQDAAGTSKPTQTRIRLRTYVEATWLLKHDYILGRTYVYMGRVRMYR